ncbi:MAG TPA: hypothetical protein VKT25_09285 [Ktedonobacteraceae bacterium]|nr:hypothetical protein [Ktedonobacteraceae bacterium]
MEQYPYDASLEWIPREYQGESPADYERRARSEEASRSQRHSGYIEYPTVDYPTLAPPQPRQYQQVPAGRVSQQQQAHQPRQQAYGATWAAPAAGPRYAAQARQQQTRAAGREPTAKGKMSKADALELLDSLKSSILVGAIIGFGVLSALVATHAVGSAAGSPNSSQSTPNNNSILPNNNNNDNNTINNPSNNGGFFNQQGGGNGFGSGGNSQPSSGTGVS